jgi:hypothetical protein
MVGWCGRRRTRAWGLGPDLSFDVQAGGPAFVDACGHRTHLAAILNGRDLGAALPTGCRVDGNGTLRPANPALPSGVAGEEDVRGKPWSSVLWSRSANQVGTWNGGGWQGARWAGDGFVASGWAVARWPKSWSGKPWPTSVWSTNSWDSNGLRWRGTRWWGLRWRDANWSSLRWRGASWS